MNHLHKHTHTHIQARSWAWRPVARRSTPGSGPFMSAGQLRGDPSRLCQRTSRPDWQHYAKTQERFPGSSELRSVTLSATKQGMQNSTQTDRKKERTVFGNPYSGFGQRNGYILAKMKRVYLPVRMKTCITLIFHPAGGAREKATIIHRAYPLGIITVWMKMSIVMLNERLLNELEGFIHWGKQFSSANVRAICFMNMILLCTKYYKAL